MYDNGVMDKAGGQHQVGMQLVTGCAPLQLADVAIVSRAQVSDRSRSFSQAQCKPAHGRSSSRLRANDDVFVTPGSTEIMASLL